MSLAAAGFRYLACPSRIKFVWYHPAEAAKHVAAGWVGGLHRYGRCRIRRLHGRSAGGNSMKKWYVYLNDRLYAVVWAFTQSGALAEGERQTGVYAHSLTVSTTIRSQAA